MIHSLSFKNFFSFKDTANISFEAYRKNEATSNYSFCDSLSGKRLSKVLALIGPNASGKTNALKVLAFLSWFIKSSFKSLENEDKPIPFNLFGFSSNLDEAAEFEVIFENNGSVYKYFLEVSKERVFCEELYLKNETNYFGYLFKRRWDKVTNSTKIVDTIGLETKVVENILGRNVSLVAASIAVKNETLTSINKFWDNVVTNVSRSGKRRITAGFGAEQLEVATRAYSKDEELLLRAISFLREVDLGLSDVKMKKFRTLNEKTGEEKDSMEPYGVHSVEEVNYELPFLYESSGTKNIYVLLSFLLPSIQKGGVAIIDELEADLHPLLLGKLVDLFMDPIINPKNTQLLFSTHSIEILNQLQKEQIILVEKNDHCGSELYRLDELRGVRRTDNLLAKYMSGAYGAIPRI